MKRCGKPNSPNIIDKTLHFAGKIFHLFCFSFHHTNIKKRRFKLFIFICKENKENENSKEFFIFINRYFGIFII